MKVFFAVPAYKGLKHIPMLDSLSGTLELCNKRGHEFIFAKIEGNCYIQTARNDLVYEFMQTDADSLFFLDDDISWHPEDALRLIEMDECIVAGVYPFKEHLGYPIVIHCDEQFYPLVRNDGCLHGAMVATGFLRIKREAIETLQHYYPQQKYVKRDPETGEEDHWLYDLFPQGLDKGSWYGEDYAFCRLWTKLGGKIWVVPDIDLGHGERKGNYHEYLRKLPGGDCSNDNRSGIPCS